ncbi:IS66 family transposase [Streptomyces sp. NPDC005065]|uniref:IS66 family transposase n=1 Tax=Streptomyces sp. NPDC005065 TaxID=3154461 RepID=UPI0033B89991
MSQAAPFPSYEELAALVVELRSELAQARARIADLEAQLGQNSTNSSKPPSSDGLAKPAPKSLRGKSGRGPGRPKGQPGATLYQVETPDETFTHRPGPCTGCGADLSEAPVVGVERRQVFDLPEEIRLQVTEHQLLSIRCACGKKARAAAPAQVAAPVQYGPRLAAVGVYLMHGQFLSKDRTARALADLFGAPVAVATVAGWVRRCARTLDTFGRAVAEQVARAPLAFFDETGFRTAGCLHWLHSASTGMFVHLSVHRRRGTETTDAAGILPAFRGVAMHDAWAPYDTYTEATHALCSAHALRELVAVTECGSEQARCAAYRAIDALPALKKAADAARTAGAERIADPLSTGELKALRTAVRDGIKATTSRASKTECKHNALFKRLYSRWDDYLRWVHDLRLPFDNNPAEQTIRMAKLRIKVSGSLRTLLGAQDFAAIPTYLATADRHGQNMLDVLDQAMRGRPWTPATI